MVERVGRLKSYWVIPGVIVQWWHAYKK